MPYTDHFQLADGLITHLSPLVQNIPAGTLQTQYAGFAAVSCVAVYELAAKEIFHEFSTKKHSVFGTFAWSYFERMNARLKIDDLKGLHIKRFGDKYLKRFVRKLEACEVANLQQRQVSVKSSYDNLILWRHQFAHEGVVPNTATYSDVVKSYEAGKSVIHCLADTMHR